MWFIFALLSAGANTVANVARRIKGRHADAIVLAWLIELATLPFAGAIFLFEGASLRVGGQFWLPATIAAILTAVTAVLLIRAYQLSEVSRVSPLLNLLPVFLLVSSYVMLGERPGWGGVIGVLVIVIGAYYINTHHHQRLFDPLRQLGHDKGAQMVILTVALWSVSTNLDKVSIQYAPVSFLVLYLYLTISLLLSVCVVTRKWAEIRATWQAHKTAIILVAGGSVLTLYFQTLAIQGAFVSYALAVKRIDVLMTVLAASIIYKEHERLKRIEGAFIMVLGVAIIYMLM